MARPRRNEHTHETIIEKGIELFSEKGYHGTGLKEILDAVKVPKGSFYHYFRSKEHFAAAVIQGYVDDLLAQFDQMIDANGDPVETIRMGYAVMIRELSEHDCRRGCLLGNLSMETAAQSDEIRDALVASLAKWRSRFEKLVERAQANGQMRSDLSAKTIADVFWCAWEGSILRMKIEGDPTFVSDTVDLMLDTLLR